jgi:hypothetical protein
MSSTSDPRPTAPRRPRKTALALAILAAVVSLASVAGAGVSQSFSDVPPGHSFFNEVEQVAAACIAQGYPDGTYRPDNNVNRGAMAAFLSRTGGRIGYSEQEGGPSPSVGAPVANTMSPWTTIASGSIHLPPGNCDRAVKLDAHATVYTNQNVAGTCHAPPCNVEIGLFVGNTQVASAFTRLLTDYAAESMALTGRYITDSPSVDYTLRARAFNVKPGGAVFASRTVLGTFYPFSPVLAIS